MKKICLCLLFFIILLIGGICYLLNNSLKQDDYDIGEFKSTRHYVETHLAKGDITNELVSKGTISGDSLVHTNTYQYKYEYEIHAASGDIIEPDTSVLTVDYYTEVKFPDYVRIIKYDVYTEEIENLTEDGIEKETVKIVSVSYMNYGELYIRTSFDAEKDNVIDKNAEYFVFHNDKPLNNITYKQKGYEVKEGMIDVFLQTTDLLMPGTEVTVHIPVQKFSDQWIIAKEFIHKDEKGKYLVYLEDDIEKTIYIDVICENEEIAAIKIDENCAGETFVVESN